MHINDKSSIRISVLSDKSTWMNQWISNLLAIWEKDGYQINWAHKSEDVKAGDFCFILSCSEIVKAEVLSLNKHNIVVHASDLPSGKGMSPLSWQILEGKNIIPVTLFEAEISLDSGDIYLQESIDYEGHELLVELQETLANVIVKLCGQFVSQYPNILKQARSQEGKETFYSKRFPKDSEIDPYKSIYEQFQLLRIVDNDNYPAFFYLNGIKYILKIDKSLD